MIKKVFLCLLLAALLTGCSRNKHQGEIFNTKPVSVKEINLPGGADESVSADQGGKGFTGSGWDTKINYRRQGSENNIKGGKLSFALEYFPVTFTHAGKDANTIINSVIKNLIYEPLLKRDIYTDELIPSLASHWLIMPDSITYKFRIDPDSRWADGRRVTSDDIIRTYKLYTDSTFLDPYLSNVWKSFDPPEKESLYIFSVRSHKKDWRQFFYFAENFFVLPENSIKDIDGKTFSEKFQFNPPAGSGPYIILPSDIQKGNSFTIRRRSDYWAEDKNFSAGLNNFDEITAYYVQDANLAFEKFKKGELDVYSVKSAQQYNEGFNFDEAGSNRIVKQKIYTLKYPAFQGICFNTRKGLFKDIRVRAAMAYLFDKNKLIEKMFYGEYIPEYSRFPGTEFENPANPKTSFRPDSALSLLNQSGYNTAAGKKNFGFELVHLPGYQKILDIYKEDLAKYGIDMHLKQVDIAYLSKLLNDKNFEAAAVSFALPSLPAPEVSFFSEFADKEGGQNWEGIKDKTLDSLCEKFPVEFAHSARIKIMQKIDSIACSYSGIIPLWYLPCERTAYHNKFGFPEFCLPRYGNFYDILRFWYYDKDKIDKYSEGKCINAAPEIDYWKAKK